MLTNFSNKKNFIKRKIELILGIKIKSTYILFMISKKNQNQKTINFINKYKIPYIFFDYENDIKFFTNELKTIEIFELGKSYSYLENKENFENIVNYNDDNEGDYNYYESESEDSESDSDSSQDDINIDDIIRNKNLNEFI